MQEKNITETERLLSENESLKQLVQQYREASLQKNIDQNELQEKAAATAVIKSYYDLQTEEVKYLRNYIAELMQKAEAAVQRENSLEREITASVNTSYQLEEIKSKYNHLQVQLDELIERLQELKNQHILQQQQISRVAELESLLANAEEEIGQLKNPAETES